MFWWNKMMSVFLVMLIKDSWKYQISEPSSPTLSRFLYLSLSMFLVFCINFCSFSVTEHTLLSDIVSSGTKDRFLKWKGVTNREKCCLNIWKLLVSKKVVLRRHLNHGRECGEELRLSFSSHPSECSVYEFNRSVQPCIYTTIYHQHKKWPANKSIFPRKNIVLCIWW